MSGIAAVYGRLSAEALDDVLHTLLDQISHRGPLSSKWSSDGIALGQRLLASTPEARHERLPVSTLGGRLQIALDGRIDNRRDLIDKLSLHNPDVDVLTDADLIVHAYDRWGVGCLEHLLGNFAFVLWDNSRRRLFAARDHQGFRPLLFARTAGGLAIGSEMRQLLAAPGIRDEPDAEFLSLLPDRRSAEARRHAVSSHFRSSAGTLPAGGRKRYLHPGILAASPVGGAATERA